MVEGQFKFLEVCSEFLVLVLHLIFLLLFGFEGGGTLLYLLFQSLYSFSGLVHFFCMEGGGALGFTFQHSYSLLEGWDFVLMQFNMGQ